jgi:HAD superfamily hydrolase (TIGR01549 family)
MDGTLIDSKGQNERACLAACSEHGIQMTPSEFWEANRRGVRLSMWLWARGAEEELIRVIRERRNEIQRQMMLDEVEWMDGAREVLEVLGKRQPIPVITNATRDLVDAVDMRLGIKKHVHMIVTSDHERGGHKPEPHGLLYAAEQCTNGHAIEWRYVGDHPFDHEAATAAGWEPWQIGDEPTLPGKEPKRVIADLRELLEF